jgi:opacity protein-like surface antigen
MKKLALVTMILMLVAASAAAAPLADYSAGKGSLTLTWNVSQKLEADYHGLGSFLPDAAKNKFSGALTLGLGNNLAFQYRSRQGESSSRAASSGPLGTYHWSFAGPGPSPGPGPGPSPGIVTINNISGLILSKAQADEYNLLYKLNPNLSVFAGAVRVKATITWDGLVDYTYGLGRETDSVTGSSSQSATGYQLGLVAATKLGDKMTGWATVGLGNKLDAWEIGLSCPLVENLDLDVSYSQVKYKNLKPAVYGFSLDSLTASGLGLGLTYKF